MVFLSAALAATGDPLTARDLIGVGVLFIALAAACFLLGVVGRALDDAWPAGRSADRPFDPAACDDGEDGGAERGEGEEVPRAEEAAAHEATFAEKGTT